MLYPDLIEVTNVTTGTTFRDETRGTPYDTKALVEEDNEVRYGFNGEPLDPQVFVMLPGTDENLSIKRGDYVKIKRMHGISYPSNREFKVNRVSLSGSVRLSHIELMMEASS